MGDDHGEIIMENTVNPQACCWRRGRRGGKAVRTQEFPPLTQSLKLSANPGFFQRTWAPVLLVVRSISQAEAEWGKGGGRCA